MIAPIMFLAGLVLSIVGIAIRVREVMKTEKDGSASIAMHNNRYSMTPAPDEPKPGDWRISRDITNGRVIVEQLNWSATDFSDYDAAMGWMMLKWKSGETVRCEGIFTGVANAKPEGGK